LRARRPGLGERGRLARDDNHDDQAPDQRRSVSDIP
jgi:hypothetical protein